MKNEFPEIKGFSVRNMQCMMQFYEEYNKELTLPKLISSEITQSSIAQLNKNTKTEKYPIAKSSISQLPTYNFELPVKQLSWTHNLMLIQRVKDIRARYWYMVQCIKSNWKVDYLKEVIADAVTKAENKEDPFVDGMEKVYKSMLQELESIGVKPIEAEGEEFDPNFHNAVMHCEDESVGENIVVQELQKGYTYHDSVVRHSMVKVAN